GLTITPTSEFEGSVTVGVSAVELGRAAGREGGSTSASLTVDPVADQPVVTAAASEISEGGTSALTLTLPNAAGLFENPDDSVTVTVSLSDGAVLIGTGVSGHPSGTFALSAAVAAALHGLTITPTSEFEGSVTVGVSAV